MSKKEIDEICAITDEAVMFIYHQAALDPEPHKHIGSAIANLALKYLTDFDDFDLEMVRSFFDNIKSECLNMLSKRGFQ